MQEYLGKKIAVGLSGGVDSSVAAYLLKRQGCDVFALFMQNWHDTTGTLHGECEWEEDLQVARMVAAKIGIPFHFVDLSDTYRKQVVDYMFAEYGAGRTPNPDVMCNSKIKFAAFLEAARSLGAEMVATGHYCRKDEFVAEDGSTVYRIMAGSDSNKDQSYFLCQLTQQQLAPAIFPIGDIDKPEVRRIAREAGLPSAEKKDSQGICFVGKVDLPVFLQQQLKAREGNIVEIDRSFYRGLSAEYPGYCHNDGALQAPEDYGEEGLRNLCRCYDYKESDGKVVGRHFGANFFTIGQRKGLNVGGHAESVFVIHTDMSTNTIYVGEGHNFPGLLRKALHIRNEDIHWIRNDLCMKTGERRDYLVRIRYRQPLQKAVLYRCEDGMYIVFEEHQRGITPGQFAVWYEAGDLEMIGSGVIE
ncbi:MAG: tRNA 2-thiouridine(34) synthase MnmA [Bacteroidales bacterium]|nr:tRNA 2-thiouridine(34) synthase MnmA [Bacteroidales bacterium]